MCEYGTGEQVIYKENDQVGVVLGWDAFEDLYIVDFGKLTLELRADEIEPL